MQTPGMMGMGKYYLTSKKFIPADGGLKRIVWMSSNLRESMRPALEEVCEREGVPDLLDKIADETVATTRRGAAALPRGEGASGPDHGSALLNPANHPE